MQYIKFIIAISLFIHPFAAISQSSNSFKVVAEVNDQIITNFEIDQRIKMLQAFGEKSISKKDIMNTLIDERLYAYSAIELEVLPNQSEIDKGLDDFAKRGNLSKKELLAYLNSRNISKETLIAYVTSGLTRYNVIQKKFINNIIVSQSDIDWAINTENLLSNSNSNVIKYIELSFNKNISNKKKNKFFNSISKMVDNCLDLQSEAKHYDFIDIIIHKKKKNELQKNILDKLNDLDIHEKKIILNSSNENYLLMLCTRNSEIDDNTIKTLRNKIFNIRINKIGNAYIQELKGEAFINIK